MAMIKLRQDNKNTVIGYVSIPKNQIDNVIKSYTGWRSKKHYKSYYDRMLHCGSRYYDNFIEYCKKIGY